MAECYGSYLAEQRQDEEDSAAEAQEWRDAALEATAEALRRELIDAVDAGEPQQQVRTTGWRPAAAISAASDVLSDWIGTVDDSPAILFRLISTCTKSPDPGVRLAAQSLVAVVANHHAEYHASDELAATQGEVHVPAPRWKRDHELLNDLAAQGLVVTYGGGVAS